MSRKKLKPDEADAILRHLRDRANCSNGCDCVFCEEWEAGYAAGLGEAQDILRRAASK